MREILFLFFLAISSIVSATTYYVSTSGNDANPGTITQPFATWQKGFTIAKAGDTVFIRGGTYYPTGTQDNNNFYCGVVQHDHDGTVAAPIKIWAYPGETPVLDCRNITQSASHIGIYFENCDNWHLKGLTVTRADQKIGYGAAGIKIYSGNNNTLERISSHHNGGSGIQIIYASENNLVLNCDAFSNFDPYSSPPGQHADGIEIADIIERNGNERVNTMRGCRSWDNGDDGYDHFRCEGILIFENCWAWHNGFVPGTETVGGNGVGFKFGMTSGTPESVPQRIVKNCISYDNRATGFSQEEANVKMTLYNNIAVGNSNQAYIFTAYNTADILRNNISYKNGADGIFKSNQTIDHNSWQNGIIVSDADFLSLDASQLTRSRKSDGSLPDITFLHLAPGSDLIDAGLNVGLPYSGQSPDLGPFELITAAPVVANLPPVVSISSPQKSTSYTSTATITIAAAASDPDGTIVKVEFFQGNVKLGESMTAPYSFAWKGVPEGAYSLTAVATDNKSLKTVSAAVSVTVIKAAAAVNQLPVVSISSPAKGGPLTSPATITIDVNASDPDGSISKVELFNGTIKLGERETAPYTFTLKDLPEGEYSLKATATDNLMAVATSAALEFQIAKYDENRQFINLYPNPNDGRFTVDFINPLDADNYTVTIVNIIGKTVYKETMQKDDITKKFDLTHLRPGVYIIMIASNAIVTTQKFIKG